MISFLKSLTHCALAVALLSVSHVEAVYKKKQGAPIPNHYIVTLRPETSDSVFLSFIKSLESAFQSFNEEENKIKNIYMIGETFKGYAGKFNEDMLNMMMKNPAVAHVEEDTVVTMADITQSNPPSWGLARISQRKLGPFNTYTYPDAAGAGVDVYVIDTGCYPEHPEFQGRVKAGAFFAGSDATDENGHGTHVMGTVLGATVGVAKNANGICVRVLDGEGSGSTSGVIQGVDYAANQAQTTKRPSIANLSLGGSASYAMDMAVRAAVKLGLPMVVAAGNENQNACNTSPAREKTAITVGASTSYDRRAFFSNYGSCVDIFAPGYGINSTWIDGGYEQLSGTSMASPHVTGIGALYMSTGVLPSKLPTALNDYSTTNTLYNVGLGSPNSLAYSIPSSNMRPRFLQQQ